jgi:transposase
MLRAGMSTRNVANNFNCNHNTIVRLRQRFLATNAVAVRPRFGAARLTSKHFDNIIAIDRTCKKTAFEPDFQILYFS